MSDGPRITSEAFPGFDQLYTIGWNGDPKWFRAQTAETWDDFVLTKEATSADQRVHLKWARGTEAPPQVIWFGVVGALLSDALVDELRQLGAKGWSTYGVDLVGANGEPVPGYQGLSVHGRCGPVQNDKSVEIMRRFPAGFFPVWKGLYFDPATWDGSDFFVPQMRGCTIIVTERVKDLFERAAVPHISLRSLVHYERSEIEMKMKQ